MRSPPLSSPLPLPPSFHLLSPEMFVSCSQSPRTYLMQHLRLWGLPVKTKQLRGLVSLHMAPDTLTHAWPTYVFQLFFPGQPGLLNPAWFSSMWRHRQTKITFNPTLSSLGTSSAPVPAAGVRTKSSHLANQTKGKCSDSCKGLFLLFQLTSTGKVK